MTRSFKVRTATDGEGVYVGLYSCYVNGTDLRHRNMQPLCSGDVILIEERSWKIHSVGLENETIRVIPVEKAGWEVEVAIVVKGSGEVLDTVTLVGSNQDELPGSGRPNPGRTVFIHAQSSRAFVVSTAGFTGDTIFVEPFTRAFWL